MVTTALTQASLGAGAMDIGQYAADVREVRPNFVEVRATQMPSERQLLHMLKGSAKQRGKAVDLILAHPDAIDPMNLIGVVGELFQRGDRLQAAFWYYFWQIRSQPWAKYGAEDGAKALRASVIHSVGPVINEWIGSDLDAMVDTQTKAILFEARAPLYAGRPKSVSEAGWERAIIATREDHSVAELEKNLAPIRSEWAERRREAGLDVGPLKDPGKPLRQEWLPVQ